MQHFINQYVRDLAWVIGSPPLLQNSNEFNLFINKSYFENEYAKFDKQLKRLDENPAELIEFVDKRNTHLLGKYFESLVEFWLMNSDDKKLLAHNLQVFKGRNTIGEFDFIYRDLNTNKVYHLECAGKFYLAHKNTSVLSNFIGPNSIDNLDRKLNKLLNEQVTLSKISEAKEALFVEGIEEKLIPQVFLKGYLFYYADLLFNNAFAIPKNSTPHHPKGWWIYERDIDYFFSQHTSKWIIVDRMNWISKVNLFSNDNVLTNTGLIDILKSYFLINSYPLLIAELKEKENYYEEISRGFIVHDTWPKTEL